MRMKTCSGYPPDSHVEITFDEHKTGGCPLCQFRNITEQFQHSLEEKDQEIEELKSELVDQGIDLRRAKRDLEQIKTIIINT